MSESTLLDKPQSQISLLASIDTERKHGLIKQADIHHFHLFGNTNGPNCPPAHTHYPLIATKLIANKTLDLSPHRTNTGSSEGHFISDSDSWRPSLRALSLASYYKLHRVPSLGDMAEISHSDGLKLPRRESTTEPLTHDPPNGVHNKILDQVIRTPGRQPSPQPTHLSVPGPGQHRVLHEQGSGYVAPKFEGKDLQMEQGMLCLFSAQLC